MNPPRRQLLKLFGGAAITAPGTLDAQSPAPQTAPGRSLAVNPDALTDSPGLEYFILGNGGFFAALQSALPASGATHCGLMLFSPAHFTRKPGTMLFHDRAGMRRTVAQLIVGGKNWTPDPATSTVEWTYPEGVPTVRIEWKAGACDVVEQLSAAAAPHAALLRTVTVANRGTEAAEPVLYFSLSPNPVLFDEFEVDRERPMLVASGYHRLSLFVADSGPATAGDRDLRASFGRLAPGASATRTVVLTLDESRADFEKQDMPAVRAGAVSAWSRTAHVATDRDELNHLFRVAQSGIRAAVATSGKMDGGLLQYNLEWVRDASMVAGGAVLAGMPEIGAAILDRLLTRCVDDSGRTLDSGRHRPPETIELDQNGELLHAVATHWAWTGDDALVRRHWPRLRAVAEYVLQPLFRDPGIGLVKNRRELWERGPEHGVREGYELSYQVWDIVGLGDAARMAAHLGDSTAAERWSAAGAQMRRAMLEHPRFSLVHDGRFIKRRLADGSIQETLEPANRAGLPPGMPLREEKVSRCDPDAANVLPVALGLVDPASALARNTLASIEVLWNQRWTGGGYGRYHVTSEPDSPGPWPFATLFIARAYAEAGNAEKLWRALHWLATVQGGRSGGWLEFYGERPVPPLNPSGFIPWTWAEIVTLVVEHLAGFRPEPARLVIRPRLAAGLGRLDARLPLGSVVVDLTIRRAQGAPSAKVAGRAVEFNGVQLELPRPMRDTRIELNLK
jgi:hypothetical protein